MKNIVKILIISFLLVNCVSLSHQQQMMKDLQKPSERVYIVAWCNSETIWLFKNEKEYILFTQGLEFKTRKIKNSDHEVFFTGDCLIEKYTKRP